MKVNNVQKWIEVDQQASSLFDVISDGTFKPTAAGKNTWKSLINDSSMQKKCNEEGFNLNKTNYGSLRKKYMKIRIGLVANGRDNCDTPNSCIGFGTAVRRSKFYNQEIMSCGNLNFCCEPQIRNVAFGFVLIK